MDIQINISEAKRALTEKPILSTSAERFLILDEIKSLYKELPQPRRSAKFLSILLSRVSTPVEPHDLIAGRCVDRLLTEEEEARFAAFIKHPDYPENYSLLNSGHCTYSWDAVVREGLVGLRQKALDGIEKTDDPDKKIFFTGCVEIYDAIRNYMLRYANEAEKAGLCSLAQNLRDGATKKPDSFASALQLLWIIALIDCAYISENPTLTVGRLDVILYPLYKKDISSGAITREDAAALVTDYYCKHNLIMGRGEHQVGDATNSTTFKRILNFDAPQYLLLGGTDANGNNAANELTELLAECIIPSFKNPVVVFRYVKDTPNTHPKLWDTLMQKALQSASLMIYNDQNVASTLARIGLPIEEARNYSHFGCNWCSTGDNGAWMLGGPWAEKFLAKYPEERRLIRPSMFLRCNTQHSWPEDLMLVLRDLAERERNEGISPSSIDEIYDGLLARMADFVDRKADYLSHELLLRQRHPSAVLAFGDCFIWDSLEKGECYGASAKYHFEILSFQMFGTVVDSIIAIDTLVFKKKKCSISRLYDATLKNFEGDGDVLAACITAEKYGMDTPFAEHHVRKLSRAVTDLIIEKTAPYFEKQGLILMPCMQSDTWHLKYGEDFGATPNGRAANTSFSQNIRPSNGASTNGLTAMLNSIASLPHDGLVSGALNLDVDVKQFSGDEGRALFSALLSTYFENGGLHAQISAATVDDLIDAQENPDLHRDLLVRVTGYSGVFVDVPQKLQNDIIERFK
jgi:formate C-acetyltransferase